MFRGLLLLWVCALPIWAQTAQPDTLRFELDLRKPIAEGWLDPKAERVGLRGDYLPLTWNADFFAEDPDGDGWYVAQVPITAPKGTRLLYKIHVSGLGNPNEGWEDGRNHHVIISGGKQVIRRAFGDTPAPVPPSFTGRIVQHEGFPSKYLEKRDLFVYLPPDYDRNPHRHYPVLYLQDGRNNFDASIIDQEWGMDEAADSLIRRHRINPVIMVGVNNTDSRIYEYTPDAPVVERIRLVRQGGLGAVDNATDWTGTYTGFSMDMTVSVRMQNGQPEVRFGGNILWRALRENADGELEEPVTGLRLRAERNAEGRIEAITCRHLQSGGGGEYYGRMLVEEIKPFIDRTYRTKKDARNTAVGGSSLGGLISMELGLRYPNIFGSLLVVSPSVWWNNRSLLERVKKLPKATTQRIWLDMGTLEGDAMRRDARALAEILQQKGWTGDHFRFTVAEKAQHSERDWAKRTPDMLLFLYGK